MLEGSPQVGGKLRLAEVGGVTVDVGAEAMLNRRPEGAALARELGLPVVHPVATRSQLWTRDALRPLPRSLMGVPARRRGAGRLRRAVRRRAATGPRRALAAAHRARRRRRLGRRPGGRPARRRGRRPPGRAPARRRVRRPRPRALGARHHPAAGRDARPRLPPGGRGRRGAGEHGPRLRRAARRARASCPARCVASGRFTVRTDATVRELRQGRRAATSWWSAPPTSPSGCAPTRWSWRSRPPRPPGCSATWRRRRPPSWPRSSTPRRRW